MAEVKPNISIQGFQNFIETVYGPKNNRHYSVWDTLANIDRFSMRALKGIRKGDNNKTKTNLLITLSWFMSFLNQLHIDLEEKTWVRFPYLCSYCGNCPCLCKKIKVQKRKTVKIDNKLKPKTLEDFQRMFQKIYPQESRTLEHAGIHLAEEMGELSEAFHVFQNNHSDASFNQVVLESADFFSCVMGVANSSKINLTKELAIFFKGGCHVCHHTPCTCTFEETAKFKS